MVFRLGGGCELGFDQKLYDRAALAKAGGERRRTGDELDHAIRQIISRAVVSDEVVDIFSAAGLKKPDISILSDEFLAEVRNMPQKNLAVELLRKLLTNEIRVCSKKFLIQSKSFGEMLEQSIRKYQNRVIEAAAVIQELIELARHMRSKQTRPGTEAHRRRTRLLRRPRSKFYTPCALAPALPQPITKKYFRTPSLIINDLQKLSYKCLNRSAAPSLSLNVS
jgi:hypothetical protein